MRQNRDTLYSSTVIDLAAGPATLTLSEEDDRYISYQIIDEDGYTYDVFYEPGEYTLDMESVGTRYIIVGARILVDPDDPEDIGKVHQIQDQMKAEQENIGIIELPEWNKEEVYDLKAALEEPGRYVPDFNDGFTRGKSDIDHLFAVSIAYGGMPYEDAIYEYNIVDENDGMTAYTLTIDKEVPVDGFWSVTVYNSNGYIVENEQEAYSINSLTAVPSEDGTITIQFGGNPEGAENYIGIMPGWNYLMRFYQPHQEVMDGTYQFPEAVKAE